MEQLQALMFDLLHINMEPDLIALKRITFSEAVVFEKQNPIPPQPDPIMARLADIVNEAQKAGMVVEGDASAIASHLIHCLVALPTSSAMMGGREFHSKDAVDAHFRQTWKWLVNGVMV